MTAVGYALSSEEHSAIDLVEACPPCRGGRVLVRGDLRPLPPLDRPPGPEPVRVGRARGDRAGDRDAAGRDGRDLPDDPHPPGDHRAGGGDRRVADARPVLPRAGHRREPQRAHPGRAVAGAGRPRGDARGGRRGHPQAVERRHDQPSRPPLHGRERRGSTRCPTSRRRSISRPAARRRRRWPPGSATGSSAPGPTVRSSTPSGTPAARGRGSGR